MYKGVCAWGRGGARVDVKGGGEGGRVHGWMCLRVRVSEAELVRPVLQGFVMSGQRCTY